MFLHMMIEHNPSNIKKKINLFISWCIGVYLYEKYTCNIEKCKYTPKTFKLFLTFTKFIISISHAIPHIMNHVCELC